MSEKEIEACVQVDISDEDIYGAMSEIPGYLDITEEGYVDGFLHEFRGHLVSSEIVRFPRITYLRPPRPFPPPVLGCERILWPYVCRGSGLSC